MDKPDRISEKENYATDRPISDAKEDRFQRYPFAKRIAETIINRKSAESIVFGLFGAWGEGKSSVLNFIDQELNNDDNIIIIHFNPWRYGDEDSLLKNFFNKIAVALEKELQYKKEKWSGFISKYTSGTKIFGLDIGIVAKALADVQLETFKERVDDFLNEANNKLVVFIDDIDRLDKQEIYTLFRLVKLTADFPNTTYILSFDETMVASAIGERFGAGDVKSGASFLEKIIQVPLNVPKAQPEALKKFCFNLVDNAILSTITKLSKDDAQRFVYQFTTNILPQLNTPRLAVRYGNTISFSLPLLNGEVNTVDLLLIEAVKIFYPSYYNFIKGNSHYFIGSYKTMFDSGNDQQKIAQVKAYWDELGKEYSVNRQQHIKNLLSDLFPILNIVYGSYHMGNENDWYVAKRIASSKYFDRYFSYAVIEGDISDVEFEDFISCIEVKSVNDTAKLASDMIEKSDAANLILKLRSREQQFEWKLVENLSKVISKISKLLPNTGGMLGFGFETATGQAAIFIYQLLKNHKNQKIFDLAKELMTYADDFTFAYSLNNWFRTGEQPEDKLFSTEQYVDLSKILTERAVKDAGDDGIFKTFQDYVHFLVPTWNERDRVAFLEYVKIYLDKSEGNVLALLKAFVPVQRSSVREGEYKIDITKKQYEYITSYFDKDDIFNRILKCYDIEQIDLNEPYWIDLSTNEFTELNMVRQFVKWYKKDKDAVISEVIIKTPA